jgi:hypothetical protein
MPYGCGKMANLIYIFGDSSRLDLVFNHSLLANDLDH